MTGLELRHYDAAQAGAMFDRLVELYLEVYTGSDDPFFGEERYRRQLTAHMAAPGFELVAAYHGEDIVGYVYGYVLPEGSPARWWQFLITPLPAEMTAENGHRTFALCEIMTLPELQGKGVGRTMHDELLADRLEERATLLAEPDNPAHAVYLRWGWQVIGKLRPNWEGAPTYDAMILPLPHERSRQASAT